MPVTNYYTVNGSIVGEKTAGGSRIDYLTDMLGSVTATVNQSAQVRNTYRYKPYGDTLAKTGTDPDPAFGWVGTQGYRPTQKKFSNFYVRARHVDSSTARWAAGLSTAVPSNNSYVYAANGPGTFFEAFGVLAVRSGEHPRTRPFDPFDPHTDCRDANNKHKGSCYACAFEYYAYERYLDSKSACQLANRYCGTKIDCDYPYPAQPTPPTVPVRPPGPPFGPPTLCWVPEDLLDCIGTCRAICSASGEHSRNFCQSACPAICNKMRRPICDQLWDACTEYGAAGSLRNKEMWEQCLEMFLEVCSGK